jgi:single-strand DNA-binding protein
LTLKQNRCILKETNKKEQQMANPKVTITGRLGVSPEAMGSGIRFRVVTSDRAKNDAGEWEDRDTSWWTVKAWKNVAESARNTIQKGQEVIVTGTMKENAWTGDDGQKRVSYEIIADSIGVTSYSLNKLMPQAPSAPSTIIDQDNPWAGTVSQ